jgi:hypothetical protein
MTTDRDGSVRHAAEAARAALSTVVDELKVQAHLGSMEAQDALKLITPQLRKVESRLADYGKHLDERSDRAELEAHLAMMEARDRWESMRDDVDHIVFSIKRRGGDAKTAFDNSRLQAHLARLDAGDAVTAKAKEIEATWSQTRGDATSQATAFIERMIFGVEQLRDKLMEAKDERHDPR